MIIYLEYDSKVVVQRLVGLCVPVFISGMTIEVLLTHANGTCWA